MTRKNKIITTVSSIVGAAAIGTGVFYGVAPEKASKMLGFGKILRANVDDVTAVTVDIPKVDVPTVSTVTVNVPVVEVPTVDYYKKTDGLTTVEETTVETASVSTPQVSKIILISDSDLKSIGLTKEELETSLNNSYSVSTYSTSSEVVDALKKYSGIVISSITLTKVDNGTVSTVTVNTPTVNSANVATTSVNTTTVSSATVDVAQIVVPTVSDPTDRIPLIIEFQKELSKLFKDQRSVSYDKSVYYDNPVIHKWIKIYKDYENVDIKYVKLTRPMKMISEVQMPQSNEEFEILKKNLEFFKGKGYNSVLVTFDGSESVSSLLDLVKYVRSLGLDVYASYGGSEDLRVTVFIDPDQLKTYLQTLAPYIHGYVMCWRRTSAHLFEMDSQYMNYIVKCLRDVAPEIPVIGEAYFGNTHKNPHEHQYGLMVNMPKNASAIMINNFGFSRVDINNVIENWLPSKIENFKAMTKIGVVLGDKPYYASTYNNGLTFTRNLEIKNAIEEIFKANDCYGTITLSNDGHESRDGSGQSNKLTKTKYYELP